MSAQHTPKPWKVSSTNLIASAPDLAAKVASLEAELAQVKAERDAANKELRRVADEHCRLNEGVANNLGRPGLHNVFDDDVIRGAGEVRRRAESAERLCRELAVGLNSVLADQTVHLPVVPGSAGVRCLCCRCNALALLSRPEVKKILEEV